MNGTKFISVNTPVTASAGKTFTSIQIVNDTKFHTLTKAEGYSHTNVTSSVAFASTDSGSAVQWASGTIIYGRYTTIQLHTGSCVLAYETV